MKVLAVFGKYNYGDPRRGLGYEYCNFIPALQRLGHEVVFFDTKDRSSYGDFKALNRALVETVVKEQPDLILSVQMLYEIWLETWHLVHQVSRAVLVNWTTDDSWRYESFSRYIASAFDVMTTTYPEAWAKYKRDGYHNVFLTQWAASTEWLQPPIPALQCKYPVTFIGTAHGNRRKVITLLKRQGIPIECFGWGWESGAIDSESVPKIIRESVISLNLANSAWRWIGGWLPCPHKQIKARVFEIPGAGGFLITENAPGLERYYEPDSEIAVFNNIHELVTKIRYFLSHPEERDSMARRGFERTLREHTYDKRMQALIEFTKQYLTQSQYRETCYDWESKFAEIEQMHHINRLQKYYRDVLIYLCTLIWGKTRGPRAARRLTFEISWRLFGKMTYSAAGIPGKLFYEVS